VSQWGHGGRGTPGKAPLGGSGTLPFTMTVRELRKKYLAFFEAKGHLLQPSGSLIPRWVTGQVDESLLFNGAGMIQFKPYFRGVAEPPSRRVTTCQKCLRTGDIEEVGDSSHLTFFEMLGNFSFGDYFKKEAIAFSWEFLTGKEWLNLDPFRLAFTVFHEDDEAYAAWAELLSSAGLEPSDRIFRLGEETNYWPAGAFTKGPPGPCGPNSEMFYWTQGEPPSGPYTAEDYLADEAEGRWLEIWNDVFISSEWQGEHKDPARPDLGYRKTGMPDLPFKSIDTGMGLERTAAVLGGLASVYDTDAFQPILEAIESLSGQRLSYGKDPETTRSMRIVSDHVRSAVFCIADGILPGSTGRGYVLRRLIRRAVLQAQRKLGFEGAILARTAQVVIDEFQEAYPDLASSRELILDRLRGEEELFRRTLVEGWQTFHSIVSGLSEEEMAQGLPGEKAFFLYDTFGFPLEVTQELANEMGLAVDLDGYRVALARAQETSRGGSARDDVYGAVKGASLEASPTVFVGEDQLEAEVQVMALQESEGRVVFALDRSPFYAESGGQVADSGWLKGEGFSVEVTDVQKENGVWIHRGQVTEGRLESGARALAKVDGDRRKRITRCHTATHLLHAALRKVLGTHVAQAGSLVSPEFLRFDFSHGAPMTRDQLQAAEEMVNGVVMDSLPIVIHQDVELDEARKMGAMALFGEKYADRVRVVQVGDMPAEAGSFSRELCGGLHVRSTGEIGLFKIQHEASAASGVRRITALTGPAALSWVREMQDSLLAASEKLKTQPRDLVGAIERTLDALKEEKRKREKMAAGAAASEQTVVEVGPVELVVADLGDADPADAQRRSDALVDPHPHRVAVLAAGGGGKLVFVVKAGPEAVKLGVHAGSLAKEVAKATGGGGGGRPNFATAGGKDVSLKAKALSLAPSLLADLMARGKG
jgi:alanyl-tRNA synthetase